MGVFSNCFPLGLGTSRFPISGTEDTAGIERSVELVLHALEAGINYIDVGYNYSLGMAPLVLKKAFQQTTHPFSVTAKVMYGMDRTADDACKRVEMNLSSMGLGHAQYFTCWTIWSYSDFKQIMEKGGIYDGAERLKKQGLIDHICCSIHAPPEDIMKIIKEGVFEGITISYSLLNASSMQPVLDMALKYGTDIAVMNPLGGGVVAQNPDYFSFACGEKDNGNTVQAALRFVKAHPAVKIVLGGVSNKHELESSLQVFKSVDPEPPQHRLKRVFSRASAINGFCSGCKYCANCPKGIPTAQIMQARNMLLFKPTAAYNREEPDELLYNIQLFRKLVQDSGWLPETHENPCIKCGRCEKSCTQKLKIIDGVSDIYQRAGTSGASVAAHKERLRELLHGKGYKRVGLYPNGGFSNLVMKEYNEFWGEPDFEWVLFNSDSKMWGQTANGIQIHPPTDIPQLNIDAILICTYKYDDDILKALEPYARDGVQIEKLHRKSDVPWVF